MSIKGGTIADIHAEAERGKAMALFGIGPLLGPVSAYCSYLSRISLIASRLLVR